MQRTLRSPGRRIASAVTRPHQPACSEGSNARACLLEQTQQCCRGVRAVVVGYEKQHHHDSTDKPKSTKQRWPACPQLFLIAVSSSLGFPPTIVARRDQLLKTDCQKPQSDGPSSRNREPGSVNQKEITLDTTQRRKQQDCCSFVCVCAHALHRSKTSKHTHTHLRGLGHVGERNVAECDCHSC